VRTATARSTRWSTRATVGFLAAVMLVSLGAHVWGLGRDLPMPDVDERYFVPPAAYIAASGDPDPHWFGHPGSTVIYPLSLAFRAREVLFHGAPLTGTAPSIAERFRTDPGSFYLMGRLWAMLFSIAALPLVFAIARRVFGELVAFLATATWAVVPLAVQYGRITRTDSVALFFALLTVWACLRVLERPSHARFAVAGVAAGLGVASRYFLAALGVLLVVTWLAARRRPPADVDDPGARAPGVSLPALVVAFAAMIATFAATTPYFFLDWHGAMASLSTESAARPFQSDGILDNVAFYLTGAIPSAISWIGLAAAIAGTWWALRRRTPGTTLVLAWMLSVLAAISVLPFHWDRWVIPALPAVAMLACSGAVNVARVVAERTRALAPRRWVFVAALLTVIAAMTIGPASALVALDRRQARPSTRVAAEQWIRRHLPAGTKIAVEIDGPDLTGTDYPHVEHYALALAGTVEDYARGGYRYLVVNRRLAHRYLRHPGAHRDQAAFYEFLRDDADVMARFVHGHAHGGPDLVIYDLGPNATLTERGTDPPDVLLTLRPTPANRVAHGSGPVPFDRRQLGRLAIDAAT
jgi:4-amino-4-deoxy-L-arabinose transferase-like glycosyltransferase